MAQNKVNGALVFFYGVWYCVIRLILDFLRVDGLLSTKIACVIVIPTFTALGIWYYLHGLKNSTTIRPRWKSRKCSLPTIKGEI